MKVLFTLLYIPNSIRSGGMYLDLVKQFVHAGHDVTIIAGTGAETSYSNEKGIRILRVKSLPILYVKSSIKKGIGMALLPYFYRRAFNKYLYQEKFDWIVMPTPPITLIDFVKSIKRKMGARLYLILRDIHPQSSASLGEIKKKWMVNYLYRRSDLGYKLADIIGCMSPANISFIQRYHKIPESTRCSVLYNWMSYEPYNQEEFSELRAKYNLQGKYIVLFGGNIGVGQRIENIVDMAVHYKNDSNIVFVIIGKGVKKDELRQIAKEKDLDNMLFLDFMPRDEYLRFVKSVDLGLISINENNAAPTCPSKAVSYMSLKIPILALINSNNDYGQILTDQAHAGYWAVGSDKKRVYELFDELYRHPDLRKQMGDDGFKFFCEHLTTEKVYLEMINQMGEWTS